MLQKFTAFLENQLKILALTAFLISALVIFVSCELLHFEINKIATIGTAFSGIIGPFLTLSSIILLYITFSEQRKTNQNIISNQRAQFVMEIIKKFEARIKDDIIILKKMPLSISLGYNNIQNNNFFGFVEVNSLLNITNSIKLMISEANLLTDFRTIAFQSIGQIFRTNELGIVLSEIENALFDRPDKESLNLIIEEEQFNDNLELIRSLMRDYVVDI